MIGDTIVALATAPGSSERAVVRLSGPSAFAAAARVFEPALPEARAQVHGAVTVRGRRLAAMALTMVAPRSFTGEHVVELHVPGSPLLVRLLQDELLQDGDARGVREALPGEFTARACRNGRMDLIQAEGLLLLLHAADARQGAAAVQWLQGGLADEVRAVRTALQDQLALLEVGLDFDEQDTGAVATPLWRDPLAPLAERLDGLLRGLPAAAPGGELLLVGHANAGKSSLANALAGRDVALVADHAGTTRDLLRVEVDCGGHRVELWDAPGDLDDPAEADRTALALRERLSGRAAGLLVVVDATAPRVPEFALRTPLPWFALVFSKCDLLPDGAALPALEPAVEARLAASGRLFATSARRGDGLAALRTALADTGSGGGVDAGGPLRTALQAAADAVRRVLDEPDPIPELAAVELQAALRALDGTGGSHSPERLLDRIYGRFCLGK